ncbi:MAG: Zn-ribbon domain-containing OB-fold protein [Pseudolabrys sp.]|nr:Zn-ribbon domain-containing OB-fold protein [Pseudolabrys sp.]
MPYLPDGAPLPQATPDDSPYWDAHARRELRIQCCADCGTFRHPPGPLCANCGSSRVNWTQVSGKGKIFSYTVAHYATHPALKQSVPYNVAVVMLEDAGDVRIVSNVVDASPDEMRIGMKVELFWDAVSEGGYLPRFRKA